MSPAFSLEELIASVREKAVDDDPIAQLARASEYANGLNEIGDRLLDRFVHECRQAEISWAELSSVLAESKQAADADADADADKRFTGTAPVVQRFTDPARTTALSSQEQAGGLGQANAESELANAESEHVERTRRTQDAVPSGKISFSRRSKNLLRAIVNEAPHLGHLWSLVGISGHREPGRPLM